MALILVFVLGWLVTAVWRDRASPTGLKNLAATVIALVAIQIALGASVIWTGRNPEFTTAHVTVGACVLATTFLLTWWLHRGVIEGEVETKFREPGRAAPRPLRS
jgi:cytochrome c oxidase assembly protein subunit 15